VAGYRSDREPDAKEVDDETDDGELEVESGHADARERQDYVLHEEVDGGAPDRGGHDEIAIQRGEHPREGEINGSGTQRGDEMADKAEGGSLASARIGRLTTEDPRGDALEQAHRSRRDDRAVNDEGGGDVATSGDKAREEYCLNGRVGGGHAEQGTLFAVTAEEDPLRFVPVVVTEMNLLDRGELRA
jgi:hypothetical protein